MGFGGATIVTNDPIVSSGNIRTIKELEKTTPSVFIDFDPQQIYFWTSTWQEWEQEADEDLRSGRFKVFSDLESLLQDLNSAG